MAASGEMKSLLAISAHLRRQSDGRGIWAVALLGEVLLPGNGAHLGPWPRPESIDWRQHMVLALLRVSYRDCLNLGGSAGVSRLGSARRGVDDVRPRAVDDCSLWIDHFAHTESVPISVCQNERISHCDSSVTA